MTKTNINRGLKAGLLCLALLKMFETYQPYPYDDGSGNMTVGYGHVILPEDDFTYPMSKKFAEELLCLDVEKHQEIVYKYVEVPLDQGQFDALTSFAFNLGEGGFARAARDGKMIGVLNEGKYEEVPVRLMKYTKTTLPNGTKVERRGLVRRRKAEVALWNGEFNPKKNY